MRRPARVRATPRFRLPTALAATALCALPLAGQAESALESPAPRLVNFETANMLQRGTWSLQAGTQQTDFSTGAGTGTQNYYGVIDWAMTDDLTFGFSTQVQEDPPISPIGGSSAPIRFLTAGGSVKYRFVDGARLDVAAEAAVEFMSFETAIFGTAGGGDNLIGSVQVPMTYQAAPGLQLHLTPGVSVFPEDLNGIPFYGTVAYVGGGLTWQPNARLQVFGTGAMPVTGGNTIASSRAIESKPVFTAGARYAFTPKVALEGYVTNALGISPTTGILTFYPDGDTPLYGLKVHYTPNGRFDTTYRPLPLTPVTRRGRQLQQDGFILSSGDVLEPGQVRASGFGGSDENYGGALAFSPDRDFQLDVVVENFAVDGSVPPTLNPTPDTPRWMAGGRIRVLDQGNGDPVSMSARVLGGREFENQDVGVLYVAAPITWQASDRLALTANPAAAAFGNTRLFGVGVGANYELFDGLQVIGEVTAVDQGNSPVYAAGARYTSRDGRFSVDLSATNSIGRHGLGTLVAQDSTRYAIGVSFATGIYSR